MAYGRLLRIQLFPISIRAELPMEITKDEKLTGRCPACPCASA